MAFLWQAIVDRARAARESNALRPIETEETHIEDSGMRFIVRTRSARKAKPDAPRSSKEDARSNPFLPPDPALTVGDLGTHIAVLNKYPVVEHHLLLVTREFVPQERLLDREDFTALALCLGEKEGLGFYNGGTDAGASQRHKHLQLVPLPLDNGPWAMPVEALLDTWSVSGVVLQLLRLPFRHAFALLEPELFAESARAADRMCELYEAELDAIGIAEETSGDGRRQSGPYNLLITRHWMLAVPRSRECYGPIQVNALGFAGSLFVRDEAAMQELRAAGPMNVLRGVGKPPLGFP
jgi:ATP adenylyltransferase